MRDLEDNGLCISIGDLVFVTGIEDAQNGQEWKEYGILLDQSILQVTADADIRVATPPLGYNQELIVLSGMASGQTIFQIEQTGPCQKAKKYELEFFVNPDRCPRLEREHRRKREEEHEEEERNEIGEDSQHDNN